MPRSSKPHPDLAHGPAARRRRWSGWVAVAAAVVFAAGAIPTPVAQAEAARIDPSATDTTTSGSSLVQTALERLAALTGINLVGKPETGLAGALAALRREAEARNQATIGPRPAAPGAAALVPLVAVHGSAAGHLTFAPASGEPYTAGTPAELARAGEVVLPGIAGGLRAADLVLSYATLFIGAEALAELPEARSTRVAMPDGQLREVERRGRGRLALRVGRHLSIPIEDAAQVRETLAQLGRPVEMTRLRVLSASEQAPSALPTTPRLDPTTGTPTTDTADADRLPAVVASIPRQTAILTAKLTGADLTLALPSGASRTVAFADLTAAAAANDVDLVVLEADPPRQTGGRTWVYRSVRIAGAERALKARRFEDVLAPLAEARGGFDVVLTPDGPGRVRLVAAPPWAGGTARGGAGGVAGWIGAAMEAARTMTTEVTGEVQPRAVVASLVAEARRGELAVRLVPGVPSLAQWGYGAAILVGLLGWRTARGWWRRLWPLEQRADYAGTVGYLMARLLRGLAFIAVFLPLAGVPAALWGLATGRLLTRTGPSLNGQATAPDVDGEGSKRSPVRPMP